VSELEHWIHVTLFFLTPCLNASTLIIPVLDVISPSLFSQGVLAMGIVTPHARQPEVGIPLYGIVDLYSQI